MTTEKYTRTAVVTGASSGIGKETAIALAKQGWRVIAHGRSPERSAHALAEIRAASTGAPVDMIVADLALMSDTARAAREIAALTDRIDVLVNNAGGIAAGKSITAEGNEATFAGNHLGPFLLTERLMPLLKAAAKDNAPGETRIVNVSSSGNLTAPGFDWADPQMLGDGFRAGAAYCNAKLANILFTRALAKRVAADGIVTNAVHPGVVDTRFSSYADAGTQSYLSTVAMISSAEGADTVIWLASADGEPAAATGKYYAERAIAPNHALADDDAAVERLWAESEALIARTGA